MFDCKKKKTWTTDANLEAETEKKKKNASNEAGLG